MDMDDDDEEEEQQQAVEELALLRISSKSSLSEADKSLKGRNSAAHSTAQHCAPRKLGMACAGLGSATYTGLDYGRSGANYGTMWDPGTGGRGSLEELEELGAIGLAYVCEEEEEEEEEEEAEKEFQIDMYCMWHPGGPATLLFELHLGPRLSSGAGSGTHIVAAIASAG
ncbi:hypothetical protein AXG93_2953s1000 [Marchantia polymorpha subsp. ruderalis]|uniref:Uncharacterized protein n=1 Tax=Marchantia polymorpha subsp. ruderalis TaxID=1480154 RepID=A0A176WLA2_MARPO|nr:hypothetical protein AXG93_2953s1000 [Marchantia polymorpha subsp. ruderalis]